jgi:hypothetical protein
MPSRLKDSLNAQPPQHVLIIDDQGISELIDRIDSSLSSLFLEFDRNEDPNFQRNRPPRTTATLESESNDNTTSDTEDKTHEDFEHYYNDGVRVDYPMTTERESFFRAVSDVQEHETRTTVKDLEIVHPGAPYLYENPQIIEESNGPHDFLLSPWNPSFGFFDDDIVIDSHDGKASKWTTKESHSKPMFIEDSLEAEM